VRGVLSLVCERSSAGEEIRMMIFCALLVSLAMWGFVANQGKTFLPRPPRIDVRAPVQLGALGILAAEAPLHFSRGPPRVRQTATA
jgi:hypothetical protein